MKKLLAAAVMMLAVATPAHADGGFGSKVADAIRPLHESLDLATVPTQGFAREAHDGNWLYTLTWSPERFYYNGKQFAHFGMLQGWRTDKGDPATCFQFGFDSTKPGEILSAANKALGIDGLWKPLGYMEAMVTMDAFGGYRFQHGPDVHSTVYGFNIQLSHKFGNDELKQGL